MEIGGANGLINVCGLFLSVKQKPHAPVDDSGINETLRYTLLRWRLHGM